MTQREGLLFRHLVLASAAAFTLAAALSSRPLINAYETSMYHQAVNMLQEATACEVVPGSGNILEIEAPGTSKITEHQTFSIISTGDEELADDTKAQFETSVVVGHIDPYTGEIFSTPTSSDFSVSEYESSTAFRLDMELDRPAEDDSYYLDTEVFYAAETPDPRNENAMIIGKTSCGLVYNQVDGGYDTSNPNIQPPEDDAFKFVVVGR